MRGRCCAPRVAGGGSEAEGQAPPSLVPAKKYCDLTGLEAKYTVC